MATLSESLELMSLTYRENEYINDSEIHALCPQLGKILSSIRPGKKLRSKLAMISCDLNHVSNQKYKHLLAKAVEELHVATLIHDDIIDNSCERRNSPSMHMQFSNSQAVLAGDYLYGKAFIKISEIANAEITTCIAKATTKIIEGEFLQMQAIQEQIISQEFYYQVIERKTALLFQICTETACILAGKSKAKFKLFGHHFGMAYQMYDDLQDYLGKQEKLGKKPGNDFHEGKLTLPLIFALNNSGKKLAEIKSMSFNNAIEFINYHNGFVAAAEAIEIELNKALDCLAGFVESEPKIELNNMLKQLSSASNALLN